MAKGSYGRDFEDRLFEKLDREDEKKEVEKTQHKFKYNVRVDKPNIYAVTGAVYKFLQKRDKELLKEVKGYLYENQKKMSDEEVVDYLMEYCDFYAETGYGERYDLYSFDDIKKID